MSLGNAGFLALLRRLEREAMDRPPIGMSERLDDDIVDVSQSPRLAFPSTELEAGTPDTPGRIQIDAQFMGLFGPQGALPLNLTEEVLRWKEEGEDGFVRFTGLLSSRFYQLFFRAWSDAHAISQHDRPERDRFGQYVGAVAGVGTPAFLEHDSFPDIARLPLVSIFGGRVRSAVRLRQMITAYFCHPSDVEEHVPCWLEFEVDDQAGLGMGGSLGKDLYLGSRVQSVNEKICIHLHLPDADTYRAFLPGQPRHKRLADLVYWYIGQTFDVDIALTLPPDQIPSARLGDTVSLGWLAALKPANDGDAPVEISRFALSFGA